MDEKNRKELEHMEEEHGICVIRQDLKGDALKSARLIRAALDQKWQEVETLLEKGADPRICRSMNAAGEKVSALYCALESNQYELARKLFEAGDRLDDLRLSSSPFHRVRGDVLDFLAFEMRKGNNYFYDESKPLSECCRCAAFKQIGELIDTASQDELNKSIKPTVHNYIHSKSSVHIEILEDLIEKGAKISDPEKEELLAIVESCRRWPLVMRPPEEGLDKVIALLKKA